jgi:hypothetical protein
MRWELTQFVAMGGSLEQQQQQQQQQQLGPGLLGPAAGRLPGPRLLAAAAVLLLQATATSSDPGSIPGAPRPLDGRRFLGYNVVNLQSGNFTTDEAYVAGTAALLPGTLRVISDCHFAVQLNHFIRGSLSYSVAVFLK